VLLGRPAAQQQEELTAAIERLSQAVNDAGTDLNVIALHGTHLCGGIPTFPCTASALKRLHPDVIFTLLDDVYACRSRLAAAGYDYPYKQLLVWRQIECSFADHLAACCDVPNIYIAAKHPRLTLYRLLFEPRCPRMYSASHITEARPNVHFRDEIDENRRTLHKDYVVFDPLTVDDRVLVNKLADVSNGPEFLPIDASDRWPLALERLGDGFQSLVDADRDVFPIKVSVEEARDLTRPDSLTPYMSIIDLQITQRDYRYIDQSDVMVAYRPRMNGQESLGVAAEKRYAAGSARKPVVEYSPELDGKVRQSRPFSTPLLGPACPTLSGFYEKLADEARREAERRYARSPQYYNRFDQFRNKHSS